MPVSHSKNRPDGREAGPVKDRVAETNEGEMLACGCGAANNRQKINKTP